MERSRTGTETVTQTEMQLHLDPPRHNVRWAEDVVDNEEMNKKKSNSNPSSVSLLHIRRAAQTYT